MAITTAAQAEAGRRPPYPGGFIRPFSIPNTNASGMRFGTTLNTGAGRPPGWTAPTPGLNGEAVTMGGATTTGSIPRTNPTGGNLAYIHNLSLRFSGTSPQFPQGVMLVLFDRLWQNSGLDLTLTTSQAIAAPVAMAARDRNGTSNGDDVLLGLLTTSVIGAGAPTTTVGYTNSAGTAGRTASLVTSSALPAGTMEVFSLDAGDVGVRSVQAFQQSATRTSGTASLILFRILACVPMTAAAYNPKTEDYLTLGLPRIFDDSVLDVGAMSIYNGGGGSFGVQLTETHG